jgi:hypothetical protein
MAFKERPAGEQARQADRGLAQLVAGPTHQAPRLRHALPQFALANPHFYAIMFEEVIPHKHESQDVEEHARAAFGALVRLVELASASGVIAAPNPVEAAQQIWSALHGAVALELKGLVLTPDPEATYAALLDTMIGGLAPKADNGGGSRAEPFDPLS